MLERVKAMNESGALFGDKRLGFFFYLAVESVMFATLFATYIIFTPSSLGAHPSEVFTTWAAILASVFLLSSSGTLIVAEKGLKKQGKKPVNLGLCLTLVLALIFLGLEMYEFYEYVHQGHGLTANNFMSAFYVLVGLHAAHVLFGILWMAALLFLFSRDIPRGYFEEKLKVFSYYWHFVDVVWVFIFAIVYAPYIF